jgi:hypothetical protein
LSYRFITKVEGGGPKETSALALRIQFVFRERCDSLLRRSYKRYTSKRIELKTITKKRRKSNYFYRNEIASKTTIATIAAIGLSLSF